MIVCTEEVLDSPRNDRRFLSNDLSFLHRTVRFTQNTTIFFKEGWHNFKEIVTFLLGSDVPSGPPYERPVDGYSEVAPRDRTYKCHEP